MNDELRTLYRRIVQKSVNNKNDARVFVCEQKLELLRSGVDDSETMQLLEIVDIDRSELPDNGDAIFQRPQQSELSCYRRFARILDVLFRNTSFDLKDGEQTCKATRQVREDNTKRCQDTDARQKVCGRKIDRIVSDMEVELGSSEWKKARASPSLVHQQQIKNARTNKAILKALRELPLSDEGVNNLGVLGMDWVGTLGYMFSVQELDQAYVVQHICDLALPEAVSMLDDFESTLDHLFAFKHHHQQLKKIIEPAVYRLNNQRTLLQYRSGSVRERSQSPDTLFTPVKKQKMKQLQRDVQYYGGAIQYHGGVIQWYDGVISIAEKSINKEGSIIKIREPYHITFHAP